MKIEIEINNDIDFHGTLLCYYDNEYARKEGEFLWEIYGIYPNEHGASFLKLNKSLEICISEGISELIKLSKGE